MAKRTRVDISIEGMGDYTVYADNITIENEVLEFPHDGYWGVGWGGRKTMTIEWAHGHHPPVTQRATHHIEYGRPEEWA